MSSSNEHKQGLIDGLPEEFVIDRKISIEEFNAENGVTPNSGSALADTVLTAWKERLVSGGTFIFDASPLPESVWGDGGSRALMARGEGTMTAGPSGIGKTTLAQQIVLKRIGIGDPDLLGYDVARDDRKILYLALDRPRQIQRMFRRMVEPKDRKLLDERLVFCPTELFPLTYDKHKQLTEYALGIGAGMIVVDSYKDLASNLSDEETGAMINRIMQDAVSADVEWLGLHHQRKAQGKNNPKPNTLSDVYGSNWLTAGLGSVIVLWGTAGDPIVELLHLKPPAEAVNVGAVRFDHAKGTAHAVDGPTGDSSNTATMQQLLILNDLARKPVGAHITLAEAGVIIGRKETATRRVLQAMVDNDPPLLIPHGTTTGKTWSSAQQI